MRKITIKQFTFITILALTLLLLSVAFAAGGSAGDKISWNLDGNGLLTITGEGKMDKSASWSSYRRDITSIEIGEGITTISDDAFYGCDSIKAVSLPSTLTKIGDRSFYGCKDLESITIPASVTKIGDYAFSNTGLKTAIISEGATEVLADVFYGCDKLESITLPSTITKIGDRAFYGCKKLKSLTIPASVKTIGDYAFSNTGLETVIIADGTEAILDDEFYGCDKLESITIPDSVTSIGARAFYGCKKLIELAIPKGVKSIGDYAFSNTGLETVILEEGLTEIWPDAFYGCDKLKSVTIPSTVTEIGERAFYGCKKLKKIVIPSGITDVGDYAFSSAGLEDVVFVDGITEIPDEMFYGCDKIERVLIPASVEEIGDTAFYGCKSLETVYYAGSESDWVNLEIGSHNDPLNKAAKICSYTDSDFPQEEQPTPAPKPSVPSEVGSEEQNTASVERPEIPEGDFVDGGTSGNLTWKFDSNGTLIISGSGEIEADGPWKSHRSAIKTIVIEEGVTEIEENAFRNYGEVSAVYIPNTVTEIGDRAFYYTTSLGSITIPAGITKMGEFVFYGGALKSVTFAPGATIVSEKTFRGCEHLESVTLPSSITTIESRAFYECPALKEITIPAGVKNWGEFIFYGSALETVTFADGLEVIGEKSFRGTSTLKTIHFPETLKEIKDRAFYEINDLEEITLPASLTKMGEFVFYGGSLKKATIAEGATVVWDGAFRGCEDLVEVILPSTITEIGERAFYDCRRLESIVIPASVTKIDNYAFSGTDLETVYFCGSESEWNSIKMKSNDALKKATIVFNYVPEENDDQKESAPASVVEESTATPAPVETESVTEVPEETTPEPTEAPVESTPVPTEAPDLNADEWECPNCGNHATGKFCNNCGTPKPTDESKPDETEKATFTPWFSYGVGKYLPKPVLASGESPEYDNTVRYNLDEIFYYSIKNATREDFENYKALLIAAGFIPSGESSTTFSGATGKGQSVYVLFLEGASMIVQAEHKEMITDSPEVTHVVNQTIVKNYVGRNLSLCGYTSMGGDRRDKYAGTTVLLVMLSPDGTYIDPSDKEALEKYTVIEQYPAADTEFTVTTNNFGEMVNPGYGEIVLIVSQDGDSDVNPPKLADVRPSPDETTQYVRDYTGRTLEDVGYTALSGKRMDKYGPNGYVQIIITDDKGQKLDPNESTDFKYYIVLNQDIAPDTEMTFYYKQENSGKGKVTGQTVDMINITVALSDVGKAVIDARTAEEEELRASGALQDLPRGTYEIGKDLPAGNYEFMRLKDKSYVNVYQNKTAFENKDGDRKSLSKGDDIVFYYLADGMYLEISSSTLKAKRSEFSTDDAQFLLYAGVYHVGVDIAPGDYEMTNYSDSCYVYYFQDEASYTENKGTWDHFSGKGEAKEHTLEEGMIIKVPAGAASVTRK